MKSFMLRRAEFAFGGKTFLKSLCVVGFGVLFLAGTAFAATPTLSLATTGGDNVTMTVNNADPNSSIQLSYTAPASSLATTISNFGYTNSSGYFSSTVSASAYGIGNGSQLYVTVNGQQSNQSVYYSTGGGGCGYGSSCVGGLSVNPSNINLTVGQSAAVNISYPVYNASFYINNPNTGIVSASISGYQITLTGNSVGNTTVNVCSNSSVACASVYVTVTNTCYAGSGYCGGNLNLSQSNVSLNYGQNITIAANNVPAVYLANNGLSSLASVSVSQNQIFLTAGNTSGSGNIYVCAIYSTTQCAYIYVTVNGGTNGNNAVSIRDNFYSPSTISVPIGTVVTWTNNGMMQHTVTSDGGLFDSGTLNSGQGFSYTFNTAGTFNYHCRIHGFAMAGTVVVASSGYGGNLQLNQTSLNLSVGQSASVYASNVPALSVMSNSNPGAVSIAVNNNQLTFSALSTGSASVYVCGINSSQCAYIYVTVSGTNSGGSLYFTSTSLSRPTVGQYYSQQLLASGGYSPYVFALSSGNLPPGLAISTSGQIYGTPSVSAANQSYYFTVQASDSYGRTVVQSFNLIPTGTSVLGASTYASGQLINENGTVYMVYKNSKSGFSSAYVFQWFGFNFGQVTNIGYSGLANSGYLITITNTSHPWGTWIKSGQTVYFIHDSGLIPVGDYQTFLNNGGQDRLVVQANPWDFQLPMLSLMTSNDYRLR
jgi:plastocyanin